MLICFSVFVGKTNKRLDVGRLGEHIVGLGEGDAVAVFAKIFKVTGERRGRATYVDNTAYIL